MEESQHMPKKMIVQKIKRSESSIYEYAFRYYSILSAINSLQLTEREIQLISFAAIKGNISYSNIRKEFCEMYNSSAPTINNIISKLKKSNILVKDGTKVKVHPIISLDFTKDITLEIKLLQNG